MMKILILGGTRFFGKRFVQLMLDQGDDVTLLTRGKSGDEFGPKVSRLVADRTDRGQLEKVIKSDYDLVVDNMLMNAQEATDAISLLKNRIGHYVLTSTLSVYNPKPGALVESDFKATDYVPGKTEGNYQLGKQSAEHALIQAPFGVSIMRIPVIVGPEDYTHRLLTHVNAVKEDKKLYFPNPDAKFSYLHAQDAARALAWLCKEKLTDVFNIGSPNALTLKELITSIEQVVSKRFSYGDEQDTPSPFGVTDDFYMNVDKALKAGFQTAALEEWMPSLINELAEREKRYE